MCPKTRENAFIIAEKVTESYTNTKHLKWLKAAV